MTGAAAQWPEPNTVVLTTEQLMVMTFDELKVMANQVGVGYTGLNEAELRHRLVLEGVPLVD